MLNFIPTKHFNDECPNNILRNIIPKLKELNIECSFEKFDFDLCHKKELVGNLDCEQLDITIVNNIKGVLRSKNCIMVNFPYASIEVEQ